ncbi:hypothetical protein D9611_013593 [Ephemerocybe angulata]|uniref:glutathione transferase n=1 Tax=Ephemerocybe angulata TaxID=980116 RepID=A0A8H5AT59_9AGAR|nr:hypothetical protein D9611_013593 [Tulosesus angulatus]
MVLTLYGNPKASCTQRVATVMHEKQVPFKLVTIELSKGEHKAPDYLEKQPFGQIPVLDDDGYLIYETRAISRYIAEKYADQGTPLIPKDLKAKGHFEQAASVEQANYDAYAGKAVVEKVFKPMFGQTPDDAVVERLLTSLEASLDVYEKILSKQKYVAGNEITLVDIFHLPLLSLLPLTGRDVYSTRPNVEKWAKGLIDRPSFQSVKDGVRSTA